MLQFQFELLILISLLLRLVVQTDEELGPGFLIPVVFAVVFKAEAILDFTFVTISVAWYKPYKTSFIELELVLHIAI